MVVSISTSRKLEAEIERDVVVSSWKPIAVISDVFFRTDTCVLIVDGSAMRPPIGSVTRKKVAMRLKPSASPASRYLYDTASKPARKFSVLNAPPQIVTARQAVVNGVKRRCGLSDG